MIETQADDEEEEEGNDAKIDSEFQGACDSVYRFNDFEYAFE